MNPIPLTAEIARISRRVIWFEEPDVAIKIVPRFIAYAMTHGSYADIQVIRRFLTDDELRDALDHAPSGIFDPRSWAYWNLMLGRFPAPPLPQRTFGEN